MHQVFFYILLIANLYFIIYLNLSLVLHSIAIVGDITPSDGVPKAEKSRMEQEALNKMCEILGGGMRGIAKIMFIGKFFRASKFGIKFTWAHTFLFAAEEIKELWEEYENNSSLEANLVKDFDKVHIY